MPKRLNAKADATRRLKKEWERAQLKGAFLSHDEAFEKLETVALRVSKEPERYQKWIGNISDNYVSDRSMNRYVFGFDDCGLYIHYEEKNDVGIYTHTMYYPLEQEVLETLLGFYVQGKKDIDIISEIVKSVDRIVWTSLGKKGEIIQRKRKEKLEDDGFMW